MQKRLSIPVLLFGFVVLCGAERSGDGAAVEQTAHSGGDMFPAAQIYFNTRSHPIKLEALKKHLESQVGGSYRLIEWKGYTTTIPQLLIEDNPSWTLQIEDDADYVPAEIQEIAEDRKKDLTAEEHNSLRACNARLEAMAHQDQHLPQAKDGPMVLFATTSLDPSKSTVRKVLVEVAKFVDGFAYDLVNDKWITKR